MYSKEPPARAETLFVAIMMVVDGRDLLVDGNLGGQGKIHGCGVDVFGVVWFDLKVFGLQGRCYLVAVQDGGHGRGLYHKV